MVLEADGEVGLDMLDMVLMQEDLANATMPLGPIGISQALQHPLAESKTDIELASSVTRNAACLFDNQRACGRENKLGASTAAVNAIGASLQCFGGNGFIKVYGIFALYPFAWLFKTALINNEMVLNFIVKKVWACRVFINS